MGVHDLSAYPEVKRLFGIPEDEPIFILRAQDILYPATLGAYEAIYVAAVKAKKSIGEKLTDAEWNFADHIEACRDNGRRWQKRNQGKVKVPD